MKSHYVFAFTKIRLCQLSFSFFSLKGMGHLIVHNINYKNLRTINLLYGRNQVSLIGLEMT